MPKHIDEETLYINDNENVEDSSRRKFMIDSMAAGGLAATLGLPGMLNAAPPSMDEVIRIGYLPITDASALLTAHGMGFFEEEGLKVAKPTLIRGWSPLVESFAAGKVNLVHLLKPIPMWMRYNNNFPVKIVSWAHINGSGIVVGKHTTATEFKDLGGMQIAVPYWYSMHNVLLQMGLKQAGLEPVIQDQKTPLKPNQVNLQILPPPDMPPALAAKKIDAYIVAEPFNAAGEMLAGAKMMRFTADMWKNHPCCVVCMNENQMNAKPEWTQKIMNALVKAQTYMQQNKEEVAIMLSKEGKRYLPMPAKVVVKAMTNYDVDQYSSPKAIRHTDWLNGRIDFQPYPYPSATKLLVNAMNDTLVGGDKTFLSNLDPEFVAKDLVEYSYVRNALEKYPEWKDIPSMNYENPFEREEVISI